MALFGIVTPRTVWRRITSAVPAVRRAAERPSDKRNVTIRLPARVAIQPTRYLAVAAIVKNEGRYLREWIEFQRLMGVEQVYLYDHGSTDNSAEVVAPYLAEGFVTMIPWMTFNRDACSQRQAYAHALCNFGPYFRWMAFIDLDEFLFPVTAPDLVAVLSEYNDCACLCVPWFLFGFSGHENPPPGLVIENYTQRAPFPPTRNRKDLLRWKSIVQPAEVVGVSDPHMFHLTCGLTGGVDENENVVASGIAKEPPTGAVLRVNHYFTRSRQEFAVKSSRIDFEMISPGKRQRRSDVIESHTVYDDTILRFAPALRERMNLHLDRGAPSDGHARRA